MYLHISKKEPKSLRNCTPVKCNCSFSLFFFMCSKPPGMKSDNLLTDLLDEATDSIDDSGAKY